jgi:hypothetical protein
MPGRDELKPIVTRIGTHVGKPGTHIVQKPCKEAVA